MRLLKFLVIIVLGVLFEASIANPVMGEQGKTLGSSIMFSPHLPPQESLPPGSSRYRSQTRSSESVVIPSAEADYPPIDYNPEVIEQSAPKYQSQSTNSQFHDQPLYSTLPARDRAASLSSSNVSSSTLHTRPSDHYSAHFRESMKVTPNSSAYGNQRSIPDYQQAKPRMGGVTPRAAHNYRRDFEQPNRSLPRPAQTTLHLPYQHRGHDQRRADIPVQSAFPAYDSSLPHEQRYDAATPPRAFRRGAYSPRRGGYGNSAAPNYHGPYTPSFQYWQSYPVPRSLLTR